MIRVNKMNSIKLAGIIFTFAFLSAISGCAKHQITSDNGVPAVGDQLPVIILTTPEDWSLRNYLGLEEKEYFSLKEIKCEILIIEIFSMYCPHCQKDAPAINKLYELIKSDENMAKRVKLIGIGAGNSAFEVDIFKKKYQIPFPLFADNDLAIHKELGRVRTPYFIGICNQGELKNRIFFSQLAGFSGAKRFLDNILELADCR